MSEIWRTVGMYVYFLTLHEGWNSWASRFPAAWKRNPRRLWLLLPVARQRKFEARISKVLGHPISQLLYSSGAPTGKSQFQAESIEWFTENQAIFRSYDSAPLPQQLVSLSRSSCMSPVNLTDGIGGGGARGAKSQNHTTSRKHGLL